MDSVFLQFILSLMDVIVEAGLGADSGLSSWMTSDSDLTLMYCVSSLLSKGFVHKPIVLNVI